MLRGWQISAYEPLKMTSCAHVSTAGALDIRIAEIDLASFCAKPEPQVSNQKNIKGFVGMSI